MYQVARNPIFLSILTGILLSISWPEIGNQHYLIFIAFIPLFFLTQQHTKKSVYIVFLYFFLSFFTWNVLTTWWIYFASAGGAAMAIILNSLFMAMVYFIFYRVIRVFSSKISWFLLIPIWLIWEKLHLYWEFSWPWLTLGNVFSNSVSWIQWYEYTGHLGGSTWVLTINILLFLGLQNIKKLNKYILYALVILVIPIFISLALFNQKFTSTKNAEVIIVQPNIDPYNEKFSGLSSLQQIQKIIHSATPYINENTSYIVAPETAIPKNMHEVELKSYEEIQFVDSFLGEHPNINVLCGINSYLVYENMNQKTHSARAYENNGTKFWIDFFNTAAQFNAQYNIQLYHKSKLVPGAEIMPYSFLFSFLEKYALDLGGTTGTLGSQKERSVFISKDGTIKVAPIICYESVYGEYVGEYVKNGANVLAIITNDGWWENTPGYKQHLSYARLRAIETRKNIVRSANTGISCFINEYGEISQATNWWQEAVIKQSVKIINKKTWYVTYGDYIVYVSLLLFIPVFIYHKK